MASITTNRSRHLIAAAAALAILWPTVARGQDQTATTAPTPAAQAVLSDSSQDVAVVNGEGITWADFITNLQAYQPTEAEVGIPTGRSMLEHLILNQIIEQLARKDGVYPTDAQIDDQFHNYTMLQEAASVLPFDEQLSEVGLTAQDARNERITPQLCQLNLVSRGMTISDADITAYYNEHKDQFTQPARAHIKRMVFTTSGAASAALSEIHQGKSFSDVYAASSDLQLADGDVPTWISLDTTEPALAPLIAAIKKTAVGEMTDPIQFQGAYWLVNIVAKKPSELWALNDVKSMVRIEIVEARIKDDPSIAAKFQEELSKAQAAADVEVAAPQYQTVVTVIKNPPPPSDTSSPASSKPALPSTGG